MQSAGHNVNIRKRDAPAAPDTDTVIELQPTKRARPDATCLTMQSAGQVSDPHSDQE